MEGEKVVEVIEEKDNESVPVQESGTGKTLAG